MMGFQIPDQNQLECHTKAAPTERYFGSTKGNSIIEIYVKN